MKRHSILKKFQGRGFGRGSRGNDGSGPGSSHEDTIRRRDTRAKQIGMEEDAVQEEAAD